MNRDYWPTQEWRTAEPDSAGMDSALLVNLDQEITIRYRDINSILVIREGYLVFERYYGGYSPQDKHLVASVTKSFTSALVGIAIEQGFIESVHQKVLDFFPEYTPSLGEQLKLQMTVRHLLSMTSGFQWRTGKRNHELYIDRLRRSKDWVAFILNLSVLKRSFGSFQYNSANSHFLSVILTRSTGRCARDFAAEQLFEPLGIEPPAADIPHTYSQEQVFRNRSGIWPQDPQGNSIGGWGLMLTPRDMARFGYLYLNQGYWDGAQILSRQWVQDSTTPHTPGYGYQWWLRDINGAFVFSAVGQGGQHIFCIPDRDLLIVVTSTMSSRWRERWPLLENYIIPAVVV